MGSKYNFSGKTFLITEEDVLDFLLLSAFLEGTGATVLHAETGSETLEFFDLHTDIDLVLMDINLPGMDGLKTTKYIKHIKHDLPILVHSSISLNDIQEIALKAGCDGFIEKPVSKENFLDEICKHLNYNQNIFNSLDSARVYKKVG